MCSSDLSSPIKVKKLGVIERIVASIYDADGDANLALLDQDLLLGTRQLITPYNYALVVIGDRIQVVRPAKLAQEPTNSSLDPDVIIPDSNLLWPAVIGVYGVLRPGISQLTLTQPDGSEIIGTIVLDPNDDRFLLFSADIDTIPANTLEPVDAVINPLTSGPLNGLDSALNGQRYLLTEDTGANSNSTFADAWVGADGRPLVAHANDIIEYNNGHWFVSFLSSVQSTTQYVTNITTGIQYEWTGDAWIKSYQGIYPGGTWSLIL